jgi:hypothetical protein
MRRWEPAPLPEPVIWVSAPLPIVRVADVQPGPVRWEPCTVPVTVGDDDVDLASGDAP